MRPVRLGAGAVTADDTALVADGRARIELTDEVMPRLAEARATLDRAAASGQPIYGLNTGLGAKVGLDARSEVAPLDPAAFQNRLVRGRVVGVGAPMPTRMVRAIMVTRLTMLAQGGSGISPHVFQALLAMLQAGIHPVVPRHGSLGESDLGLLSHVALVLIGEGEAEHQGQVIGGGEALRRAGIEPAPLGPKDGLALINASAVSVGTGALAVVDAARLMAWQEAAAALGFAAIRANRRVFDPRIQLSRPAPGQAEAASRFRHLLNGTAYEAAALQDPLSFRCLASVQAALADALERAKLAVEVELNAASDNPLVLQGPEEVLSTGNFATPAFALAIENLALATAHAAQTGTARSLQLSNGMRAGLPRSLSPLGGTAAGFVPLQKTAVALMAELRRHAVPAMLDVWPVSEGVEDHATQSPLVVTKFQAMLEPWRHLIAIELLAAAQAADLQPDLHLGGELARLHVEIRAQVGFLSGDRPLGSDVQRLADWLGSEHRGSDVRS